MKIALVAPYRVMSTSVRGVTGDGGVGTGGGRGRGEEGGKEEEG